MNYGVYAIKDEMDGTFMQPWMIPEGENEEVRAKRFAAEIARVTDIIKNNSNDYQLYRLADFNDHDGYMNLGFDVKRIAGITEIMNERRKPDGM